MKHSFEHRSPRDRIWAPSQVSERMPKLAEGAVYPWDARRCTIAVESAGLDDGNTCSFTFDSKSVIECPSGNAGRGFNLRIVDEDDCSIVEEQHFDTHLSEDNSAAMQTYVENLPSGTMLLVAVQDEACINQPENEATQSRSTCSRHTKWSKV